MQQFPNLSFASLPKGERTFKKREPAEKGPARQRRQEWNFRQRKSWRILFGWILCVSVIVVCAYFSILYGLDYGWDRSVQYIISMAISLFLSIVILQPLKMVVIAYIYAKFFERGPDLEEKTAMYARPVVLPPLKPPEYRAPGTDARMYRKLTPTEAQVLRTLRRLREKLTSRATDTMLWVVWILCLGGCVLAASDSLFFYMQKHVKGVVLSSSHTRARRFGQFYDVLSYGEVYEYLNRTVVASLLHRKAVFNESPEVLHPYVAFAADDVTRVIGVMRLRQQRVRREPSCEVAEPFRSLDLPCYTDYWRSLGDREDYDERWQKPNSSADTGLQDPSLGAHAVNAWKYQSAEVTESVTLIGKDTSYEGGGYVAHLGRVLLNAEVGLMYLASSGWLDRRTRGLFIEFVLYSPSANIFCDVCLFLERTAASSIQYIAKLYTYRLDYALGRRWQGWYLAAMLLLAIVSVVMVVREAVSFCRLGRARYSYNWFDVILVVIVAGNGILYFVVNVELKGVMERIKPPRDQRIFVSFQETTLLHSIVLNGLGLLVVLATVRCWRVLSFASHFQVVKAMLREALSSLAALVLFLVMVQAQFALLFTLIMGSDQENLHSVPNAFVLLLAYLVDYTADYEEFAATKRDNLLAFICYWVFVGFMYFIFLNFFLGIVSMAFETAVERVRQQRVEGFSLTTLILDELRFLLHLPGARPRRDSSLYGLIRKNFIDKKKRVHGETLTVARAELDAMFVMHKLFTDKWVSDEDLEGTMATILLIVSTYLDEIVKFPGPTVQMTIGHSWDGEELLNMRKLHSVMDTLNERNVDRGLTVDDQEVESIRSLVKDLMGRAPPSAIPITIR